MASIQLSINCGCGYRPKTLTDAEAHTDETLHIIHLTGVIIPTPAERKAPLQPAPQPKTPSLSDFERLRSMLGRSAG